MCWKQDIIDTCNNLSNKGMKEKACISKMSGSVGCFQYALVSAIENWSKEE